MTRDEAIRKHRAMWRWLAENPGKWNEDYLQEFDPKAGPANNCYLCDYADKGCDHCPLEWPGGNCVAYEGLYIQWNTKMCRGDYINAAEIARQIAELPEKEVRR